MSRYYINDDYVTVIRKPKKNKQAQLPKTPNIEPLSKIIPGKHPVKFQRAKDLL
jgi:hypothetical protein